MSRVLVVVLHSMRNGIRNKGLRGTIDVGIGISDLCSTIYSGLYCDLIGWAYEEGEENISHDARTAGGHIAKSLLTAFPPSINNVGVGRKIAMVDVSKY